MYKKNRQTCPEHGSLILLNHGEWVDGEDRVWYIHANYRQVEETIRRVKMLEGKGVEVVFAHDVEWETDRGNAGRIFGAKGI